MAFRWKQYGDRTPDDYGMVPPEIGEQQAVSMQGYTPNSAFAPVNNAPAVSASAAMAGYRPINSYTTGIAFNARQGYGRGMAPDNMDVYEQYRADASREAADAENRAVIEGEINKLQAQLNSIDARIAQIDKEVPGIGGNEWEIAAKRAEVGDFSAYDNIVSRGHNRMAEAKSTAKGIENELYNAAKLTWGLKADSTEDRAAARNQIEVALERAKSEADKTGAALPSIYYELEEKLAKSDEDNNQDIGNANARITSNAMFLKANKKTLTDADIEAIKAQIEADPNGEETEALRGLVKQYENDTVEKRAARAREKAAAEKLRKEGLNKSKDDLEKWWNGLTVKQRELLTKYGYKVDLVKGTIQ
ncbi:DUF5320 domain-containing protein [Fibrobacter sp. UWP2]|uniref:DUF5320 domain-containing protein n=1 Tax=Fibrobacter sp. UWP2 TaxID=1896216 RepID=UPI00091006C1|nr:DUF5320 domain-containing protein [Fibrobacter sp. UWP2]SHI35418.1 hypothetical protein SAMN05720471_101259 [Fibrobacter sp. UWP2]